MGQGQPSGEIFGRLTEHNKTTLFTEKGLDRSGTQKPTPKNNKKSNIENRQYWSWVTEKMPCYRNGTWPDRLDEGCDRLHSTLVRGEGEGGQEVPGL